MTENNWANVGWFALLPTLGVTGLSFVWLLMQTVTRQRVGWITEVAIPAILAGYSVLVMLPDLPSIASSSKWSALISFALAIAAGLLFDLDASLDQSDDELQERRSPWPLLLWGLGAFLYVVAPVGSYLEEGWRDLLERWSGAVLWVAVGALIGQALNWARRLLQVKAITGNRPRARGGDKPRPSK